MSVILKARVRETSTKSFIHKARKEGRVPGIVYGGTTAPQPISLAAKELAKHVAQRAFRSHVHELNIDGKQEKVLVKDIAFHPVNDTPEHVDFLRVSEDTRLILSLPLEFQDRETCPGLKMGGLLNIVVKKLVVSVSATSIPECIAVSLKDYQIGQSIHLKDIVIPESLRVLRMDPTATLATILAPGGENDDASDSHTAG